MTEGTIEQPAAVHGPVIVRDAEITDAPGLTRVYVESARHHVALDPDTYTIPDQAAVLAKAEEQLARRSPDLHVIVADVAGQVVGSADVRIMRASDPASMIRPRTVASIGVAVLAKYRGRGIGERLMRRAEQWAVDHGAEAAVLDMSAANVDARRFYTDRLGYTLAGWFLTKKLDDHSD